jgi:ribosome-binding protein aMBF1 (putative translation factor)
MAEIHELKVTIRADASSVDREMRKASNAIRTSTGQMEQSAGRVRSAFATLVPALAVSSVIQFGSRAIEAAGHMQDLSDRIGFAASTLSALEPALAASGASVDDFAASINLMNNTLGEAAKGTNQAAVKAFDDLGLSVRALQRLSPEQQFYAIVQALSQLDNQYQQTEAGRNIFGRGFASLIPLIKEANGNLEQHVQTLKDTKEALSDDTIARIDAFGDAMSSAAVKIKNEFLEAFAAVLKVIDTVRAGAAEGGFVVGKIGSPGSVGNPGRPMSDQELWEAKSKAKGFATEATFAPPKSTLSAKGSNAGLIKETGSAAKDAAKDYDTLADAMQDYLLKLENERELAGLSGKALAERRAILEASAISIKEGNLLSDEQRAKILAEVDATYELSEAATELRKKQDEARQAGIRMTEQLRDGLTDLILDFNSAGDAVKGFLSQIANQILKANVTGPLADALGGALKGGGSGGFLGGIGKIFGFADGGSPPVGVPSIVGERGPEIFVPQSSGTVIPNHALGGKSVTIHQTFHMSPGLQGTVAAEVRRAAPQIAAAAKMAVFQSIERGGTESRLVNRKS